MDTIVITGLGGVSPIGIGSSAMTENLLNGKHGYKDISALSKSEKYPLYLGGTVDEFSEEDFLAFPPAARFRGAVRPKRLDPVSKFGLVAAKLAAQQAGMIGDEDHLVREEFAETAVVMGIALSGVETYDRLHEDFVNGKKVSPLAVPMYMTSAVASVIATYFNFLGSPFTVNTACASSITAIIRACDILQLDRPGGPKFVIAGGAEASLTDFVSASFLAAKAMSPDGVSRPFDRHRNGFGPGEGAGALVLERKSDALARGATILAEIIGFDERHDHYDADNAPEVGFTAPDTTGGQLAASIRAALAMGGVSPESVDAYNAHGTGTKFNDLTEANALKLVFGERLPAVMALKGFFGHSGGATSVLEIICGLLAMDRGFLPGNPSLNESDPELGLDLTRDSRPLEYGTQVKSAMGFGGARAVLAYRKASLGA